jgi:hypothetical protein
MPTEATGFEKLYPNIARWVKSYGWIEIGGDLYSHSLVRAFDEGSTVWESKDDDAKLDETLNALESFLAQSMKEYYA